MFVWPEPQTDFVPEVMRPDEVDSAYYFVFQGNEILHTFDSNGQWIPVEQNGQAFDSGKIQSHYMGSLRGMACFAVETDLDGQPRGNLRSLFGRVQAQVFSLAGRGLQILEWFRTHRFCGKCGRQTVQHPTDRAMVCETCGIHSYPRLSPSIITLVHDKSRVLLARNHRFPEGMYSTLAGFVEPGESIEQTLIREVKEEVGVRVKNLKYLGSQPWAFPNSLMLGFHAEYESGDIVLQEEEIADARWFECDQLPDIPGNVAISRWLIDDYLSSLASGKR